MESKIKIKSKLDRTKQVEYYESREINNDDIRYETTIYETDILGKPVIICLGRPNYTFKYKNIVYFPIYLMRNDVVRSHIGVYEVLLDNLIQYSNNGQIDTGLVISQNDPLLYSFTNPKLIKASGSVMHQTAMHQTAMHQTAMGQSTMGQSTMGQSIGSKSIIASSLTASPNTEESKATDLQFTPKTPVESYEIFELDKTANVPELLKEEMKPDNTVFNDTSSALWIQRFLESYDYRIIKTQPDGDCFFSVVQRAFAQIGKKTTIDTLRHVVADALTVDIYEYYFNLFVMFISEIADTVSNIEKSTKVLADLKRRFKNIPETNQKDRQQIHKEIIDINHKIKKYKDDNAIAIRNRNEVRFMENVESLKDLKVKLRTQEYWADEFAISVLENALNVKFIILSEKSFRTNDYDSVMKCQLSSFKKDTAISKPDYYIIVSYNGDHYNLISYKDKNIFTFTEIPYKVKTLIVNKCIEKNDGSFGLISDFIHFQERLGIEIESTPEELPKASDANIDKSTVFMFHKTSADEKPGKGSGEQIAPGNIAKYNDLIRIKDWRRILSDESTTPFSLDGKRWKTAEHYIQGSQFKKGFPDFYKLFSLDTDHEISKDVEAAIGAGSKTGMYKKTLLRPKTVKIDPDFFDGRNKTERAAAVSAKFQENEDARDALILTKDAMLKHFERGRPAETDDILMEVRQSLSK